MDEPHMTSEQIWFLAAIWETRSLALAAKRLGISVATATRLLRSVRSLLQDPLFVRGKGGFVPTNRMTRLMPAIEDAQNALRELARTGEFDPASVRGTLRLAGVDNAVLTFLRPVFQRLLSAAPELRISFSTIPADWENALEEGTLDMLFYAHPMKMLRRGFRSAELNKTGHVLVVRKSHPIIAELENSSPGDRASALLDNYRGIEITYGPGSRRQAGETSAPVESDKSIALQCDYFLPSVFLLLESDCYARMPLNTARYLSRYLPIALLPPEIRRLPVWSGRMIWHERTDVDPLLLWVRRLFMNEFRSKRELAGL